MALLSGLFWAFGLAASFYNLLPEFPTLLLFILSIILGGFFALIESISALFKRKFNIDFLMIFAAAGAMILGRWAEASLLLFLFSLGHALEQMAMNRARKSIKVV